MESIDVDNRGAVVVVTLNRPDRRNALDTPMKVALRDALALVASDSAVRAVVVAGSGGHFCAGQDLSEHAGGMAEGPEQAFATVGEHYAPIIRSLATMPKPVVAAVQGTCAGAGLSIALACDVRVIGTSTRFATAFSGIGLTTDSGLSHTLPRAVGEARARELILLGEPFDGPQAVAWGIAGSLVDGDVTQEAIALATRLAAGPTAAFAESKRLLAETWSRDLAATLEAEAAAQTRAGGTADHSNAVRAFLAKQKPVFEGR
jgi:2-(1,2-epoxy-1,2-dihydrophenyl)acetyl-CoA isomerase